MGVHASTVGSQDLETEEIRELNCIQTKEDEACTSSAGQQSHQLHTDELLIHLIICLDEAITSSTRSSYCRTYHQEDFFTCTQDKSVWPHGPASGSPVTTTTVHLTVCITSTVNDGGDDGGDDKGGGGGGGR